jgi:hypothetical protein
VFVTSDIFDLEPMARDLGWAWQENLLGGVEIHGIDWPGSGAAMHFLDVAGERCGLLPRGTASRYNGGNNKWDTQDRTGVFFSSERTAGGMRMDQFGLGGRASVVDCRNDALGPVCVFGPPWRFTAGLLYPLDEYPIDVAQDLLRLASEILDSQYSYHFIRDAFCHPWFYTIGGSLWHDSPICRQEAQEALDWSHFVSDGDLWFRQPSKLRDVYQVNLLSDRHMRGMIDGIGLPAWIAASPERGVLQGVGKGRWLWTLTDRQIVAVRPLLNAAGLLFACSPRVYRDLPDEELAAEA